MLKFVERRRRLAVPGEAPGQHHVMGAALILPGIYLATRPMRKVQT